jgi:hypothetical protein
MAERLVEAVARVIFASRAGDDSTVTPDDEVLSAYGLVPGWRLYEDNARAVLAMPELAAGLRLAKATDAVAKLIDLKPAPDADPTVTEWARALSAYRATRGVPR